MNFWEAFLPLQSVQALSWTLLHSLWQGAILALALRMVLALDRKNSPQLRYVASLLTLSLMLGWAGLTFYQEWQSTAVWEEATLIETSVSAPAVLPAIAENAGKGIPWEGLLPYLSLAWMIGCLFFTFRWLGGLWYLHRLRHSYAFPVNVGWQHKVNQLSSRMGIRRTVKLLESSRIAVPLVIGHLKPVILLPFGMLSGISPKQLESILAHELAHIRRYDYLVNQFLAVMEMVFFYHPAYWWVSNQVEESREHCCDDIAVSICEDAITYARMLTDLESYRQQTPHLALGMAGKNSPLMHRIQRIVSPQAPVQQEKIGISPAIILTVCLVALLWVQPQAQAVDELSVEPVAVAEPVSIAPQALPGPGPVTITQPASEAFLPGIVSSTQNVSASIASLDRTISQVDHAVKASPLARATALASVEALPLPRLAQTVGNLTESVAMMESYLAAGVDTPPRPPAPPVVRVPEAPAPPRPPADWDDKRSVERWEADMEVYAKKMEKWGEKFGKQWSKENEEFGEQMDEFGAEMEEFGAEMDEFGAEMDEFGAEMDEFGEEMSIQFSDKQELVEELSRLAALGELDDEDARELSRELRKLEREIAEDHRERAEEHRAHARHKMEEMRELERSLAREQAEMVRHQAEIAREMAHEQRQVQRELVEEQREMARRLAAEARRTHAERDHRAHRDPHHAQLERFHQALVDELEQDGLIDDRDRAVEIEIKDDYVRVNGKKLNRRLADKYRDLADRYDLQNGQMIFEE